jgi:formamidopyrimidine-DNA glycosylase
MPELPETETIARDLDATLRGIAITAVAVPRPDVLRATDPDDLTARVVGRRIVRAWRRAKLIVLDLAADDGALAHLVVQPRFTGALLIEGAPLPAREAAFVCATWTLADGRRLHYRDIRRLGTVALLDPGAFAAYTGALGPEPLDPSLSPTAFSVSLRRSRQALKKVLMDQRMLAGVGNIYATEACWLAGLDPSRPADSLAPAAAAELLAALRDVLTRSIAARGTSFRDYVDARGERGSFVPQLAAYGRGGAPCRRCGTRLAETMAIDGRTTVFCWRCQH